MVKMLTVLVSTISSSQVYLLKKYAKATQIFLAKMLANMPYLMISLTGSLVVKMLTVLVSIISI